MPKRKPAPPPIPHHELVLMLAFGGRPYGKPQPPWVEHAAWLLADAAASFEHLMAWLATGHLGLAAMQWRDYRETVALFDDVIVKRHRLKGLPSGQGELEL